jgi:hypothetical protein
MGVKYWQRIALGGDFQDTGVIQQVVHLGIGPANPDDILRRSIGYVWFANSNSDLAYEHQFPEWGIAWAFYISRNALHPDPSPGLYGASFLDVDNLIHLEVASGERYDTSASGVPFVRYPRSGGSMKMDTSAQRLPEVGGAGVEPLFIWHYNIGNVVFDETSMKTRINASFSCLYETPG